MPPGRYVLTLALLAAACSDDPPSPEPDAGDGPSSDASASADGSLPDAGAPDAPALQPIGGTWHLTLQTGPTYDGYWMTLSGGPSGGPMSIDREKSDGFGDYINCLTIERVDGTWSFDGSRLEITPVSGTIRRIDDSGILDCDEEDLVDERPMTPEEIADRDHFSGDVVELTATRLSVERGSWVWSWQR